MHFSNCHQQMSLDRQRIFTTACLMIATLARVSEQSTRISRSINDHVDQPSLRTHRLNSIDSEDRSYDRRNGNFDNSIVSNHPVPLNSLFPSVAIISNVDSRNFHDDEEEKLFAVITSKDYRSSTPAEIEKFDRIGERMIARANITEEAKRVVREVKRQRPGFFWTLARVAFETVNETRSAIEQISNIVQENFAPDTTTSREGTTTQRITTMTSDGNSTESTTEEEEEEESFKFTRNSLQSLVRRNLRGLVRLFNIEWRDALNQSQKNVREFQRDLGNRISPFIQNNPDVV